MKNKKNLSIFSMVLILLLLLSSLPLSPFAAHAATDGDGTVTLHSATIGGTTPSDRTFYQTGSSGVSAILFQEILNKDTDAYMSLILAHELAHVFGLDDVYDNSGHDVENGFVCVMEYYEEENAEPFYDRVLSGEDVAFCESCQAQLYAFICQRIMEVN